MSLRSRLFNGDPRLEACRLQDSAHIAPGAVGDHVGKIHQALLLLNDASIGSAELLAKSYGIVTARAVLDYKTKRHIINTSYQTRPDNVVGKMTITALDEEMAFAESRGGGRPQCVDQIGGTSIERSPASQAVRDLNSAN